MVPDHCQFIHLITQGWGGFNQVKLFNTLATKLYKGIIQHDQYQSVCTKIMLDVIQICEKQVVTPPIKGLLDVIKAAAFAKCKPGTSREVRENDTDITSESSEEKLEIEKDLIKKEHICVDEQEAKSWSPWKPYMKEISGKLKNIHSLQNTPIPRDVSGSLERVLQSTERQRYFIGAALIGNLTYD
ncbi:hypothetical protein CHS0354_014904 [Potamilus streckersoni]|uniref:Uncharacterized protein n=1 Tax=Potamilus streckersoni TaxID=2493646 RepID=A0AAE0W1I6_9BIVA|nr:hypothetical protein CHS0354_014904 [Potamilus streckersoni]